jgi:hypothetical protein
MGIPEERSRWEVAETAIVREIEEELGCKIG